MRRADVTNPIVVPQLYERIAERLASEISSGSPAAGERLPSERELARRLGVGRSSVREAIAVLQLRGILETRHGSGSYVATGAAAPQPAGSLSGTDYPADASPSGLLDARAIIEPRVARIVADHAQPDFEAEELLAVMADEPEHGWEQASPGARDRWNNADRMFHRRIAHMTQNAVLASIADYIAQVMDQPLWQRLRDEAIGVPGRASIHVAEHRMIYEAIVEGDPDAAEFNAAAHIKRVRRYMSLD